MLEEKTTGTERKNARQTVQALKAQLAQADFERPNPCNLDPPDEINVYTDGSLKNPKRLAFAIAGAGIWWPR